MPSRPTQEAVFDQQNTKHLNSYADSRSTTGRREVTNGSREKTNESPLTHSSPRMGCNVHAAGNASH